MVTVSGGELVRSELPARPSVQKRIHKLAVILSKAALISNVVEFTFNMKGDGQNQKDISRSGPTRSHGHSPFSESLR